MINEVVKDITTVDDGLVLHGVNCRGVMGSGVAKAIRDKWPIVYERYKKLPSSPDLLATTQILCVAEGLHVANCFTQVDYGSDGGRYADLNAVNACLRTCFSFADLLDLHLRMPKIGCGLGGLKWDTEVLPVVESHVNEYPSVEVTLYTL